jgi:hypothetical protein
MLLVNDLGNNILIKCRNYSSEHFLLESTQIIATNFKNRIRLRGTDRNFAAQTQIMFYSMNIWHFICL